MNEDGIIRVCHAMGLKFSRAYTGTPTWGANMSIACPLAIKNHSDPFDDNMSCSIKVVGDGPSKCKCWSGNCRFKGDFVDLIRTAVEMRNKPPELMALLQDVEKTEQLTRAGSRARTTKALQKANTFTPPVPRSDRDVLAESHFDPFKGSIPQYAIERGITVETAKAWGLGYDKEAGFLVFPVRRTDQKLVGMVGRAVSDKAKRRHHNYMGLDKSKHLFGAHMLQRDKPVVIVESCIDALNTWQALRSEEASVVASLGEGWSDFHSLTLGAYSPPFVYIFTDGDKAGRLMANKIAYSLNKKGLLFKIMECPWGPVVEIGDGKLVREKVDPSDLPDDYIRKLFREAPTVRRKIKWTNPPVLFDSAEAA